MVVVCGVCALTCEGGGRGGAGRPPPREERRLLPPPPPPPLSLLLAAAAAAARSARVAGGSRLARERDSGLESNLRAPLPSVSPRRAYPPTTTIAGGLHVMVAVCAERAKANGVSFWPTGWEASRGFGRSSHVRLFRSKTRMEEVESATFFDSSSGS